MSRNGLQRARVPRAGGIIIADPDIDRPIKPCCRCGEVFQPTTKRRMLCRDCFVYAPEDDPPTYAIRLTTPPR